MYSTILLLVLSIAGCVVGHLLQPRVFQYMRFTLRVQRPKEFAWTPPYFYVGLFEDSAKSDDIYFIGPGQTYDNATRTSNLLPVSSQHQTHLEGAENINGTSSLIRHIPLTAITNMRTKGPL